MAAWGSFCGEGFSCCFKTAFLWCNLTWQGKYAWVRHGDHREQFKLRVSYTAEDTQILRIDIKLFCYLSMFLAPLVHCSFSCVCSTGMVHCRTTRNPHDPKRYTGGSSSGSAAIVAAGLCSASLGTDGGGIKVIFVWYDQWCAYLLGLMFLEMQVLFASLQHFVV